MIKIETVDKPFIRYVAKVIPLAFDESMSYYECLCSFYNYLKNEIMPTINNNAEATKELQDLYVELKSYVDNYFDNLDITEEVNAKLDEMAESGELQEIIAEYLQLQSTFTYNNVAELKEAQNLVDGMFVRTSGYYSYNDGGGSFYKVRNVTTSDTVDDMFIIELDNNEVIAELIINGDLKLSQLGLNNETANNTLKLESAINYINDNITTKLIIDKDITVTNIDLSNSNGVNIVGNTNRTKIEIEGDNNLGITMSNNSNTLENLYFITHNDITLLNVSGKYNHFINCNFYGDNTNIGTGIIVSKWSNIFDNCMIREFKECIKLTDEANYTIFNNSVIIASDTSNGNNIYIDGGTNIVFSNCEIEKGSNNIYINGGQSIFQGNYIEGASGSYAITLYNGNVTFTNNYFSNSSVAKYDDCKATFTNNTIRKTTQAAYFLRFLTSNLGYFVADNNKFVDSNGLFLNIAGADGEVSIPRYWDGSTYQNATKNDYLYINQEQCYNASPALTTYVYRKENGQRTGGGASSIPTPSNMLRDGSTYGDRNKNKLLFFNANQQKWFDSLGNTPAEKRTSAPSSGSYVQGDIVWNSQPTAGGVIGWVCVSSGTPGTWKTFGNISS